MTDLVEHYEEAFEGPTEFQAASHNKFYSRINVNGTLSVA